MECIHRIHALPSTVQHCPFAAVWHLILEVASCSHHVNTFLLHFHHASYVYHIFIIQYHTTHLPWYPYTLRSNQRSQLRNGVYSKVICISAYMDYQIHSFSFMIVVRAMSDIQTHTLYNHKYMDFNIRVIQSRLKYNKILPRINTII